MPVINRGSSGGLPQGFVQMPIIVAPAEGAFILPNSLTITGTPFGTVGIPDTLKAVTVQLARDEAFTDIFHTQRIVTTATTVTVAIPAQAQGSTAFARLIYEGEILGESEPGAARKLVVTKAQAPTITNPMNDATGVPVSPTIELSPWADTGGLDTGSTTRVQLSTSEAFESILWDSGDLSYRTSVAVDVQLSKGQVVYCKAWHNGKLTGKTPDSAISKFTTKARDDFSLEKQFITAGNYTFTVPEDTTKVRVLCIGASAYGTISKGGKGGAMLSAILNVTPGQIIPLTVGALAAGVGTASSFDGNRMVSTGGSNNEIGTGTTNNVTQVLMNRRGAPEYKTCDSFLAMALDQWIYDPRTTYGGVGHSGVYGGPGAYGAAGEIHSVGYGVGGMGGSGGKGGSGDAGSSSIGEGGKGGKGGYGGGYGGRGGKGGVGGDGLNGVYNGGYGGEGGEGGEGGYNGGVGGVGGVGGIYGVYNGNGGSGGKGGDGGTYGGNGGKGGICARSSTMGYYGGNGGNGGYGGVGGDGGEGRESRYGGRGGSGGPGCVVIWY